MKDYIFKRPMLLCAIICVVISITGYYSKVAVTAFGIFYAIFIGIAVLKGAKPQILVALFLAFIMLLSLVGTLFKADDINSFVEKKKIAEAVVCEVEKESKEYNLAVMEITNDENLPRGTKVYCFYEKTKLTMGQTVKAEFKFKAITNPVTKASSYSEDIFVSANVYNIEIVEGESDFVLTAVDKVRSYIKSTLFSNMGYDEASTMCALVFGDRSYFTDEFYSNVKGAGVSHVMVVSGMHLSILVMLCLKLSEKLFYNRYLRVFIMASVVIALTTLCGFTMSILRAGITYAFMALSILIDKDNTPANTLGAAVVSVLMMSPFAVFSVAFQLSVLSTFGILAVAIPITDYSKSRRLIKSKAIFTLLSAVIITLSATLLTLPVSIYTFGYVSVVSVLTNLLISFAVTLALSIAVVALFFNLCIPFLGEFLFEICNLFTLYINKVINYFGSKEFSVVSLPEWSAVIAILLIIFIFYCLLACKKRIDMLKLEEISQKRKQEGVRQLKWQ